MRSPAAHLPRHWPLPLRSFVDGRFLDARGTPSAKNYFACTGELVADVAHASDAEVEAAIEAAARAQPEWARRTPTERGRVLVRAAQILSARNSELAMLETLNTSRAISETLVVDIKSAADAFEYFGGSAAVQQIGQSHRMPGSSFVYTLREPLGVAVGIGAFNYPLQSAAWKAAPCLAFGNAMCFKPAEDTPMTALALAEILKEAGLPDGLFSVVLGGKRVGEALVRNPKVNKISFTGSEATGASIAGHASPAMKRLTLELGGKSPLIVFPDADLDKAVTGAVLGNFYSNGEVCSNATRVFVHELIYDAFLQKFEARARKLRIGDARDPAVHVGALINHAHRDKVLGFIQRAQQAGVRLACGGRAPSLAELGGNAQLVKGAFVLPTIFADVKDSDELARDEVFGPVAAVLRFRNEDEVIARANDTKFGLSGGVFTTDLKRAHRVAARIKAGGVYINNYNLAPVEIPWGGVKKSGLGRENGTEALHYWTETKTIHVELDDVVDPYASNL